VTLRKDYKSEYNENFLVWPTNDCSAVASKLSEETNFGSALLKPASRNEKQVGAV